MRMGDRTPRRGSRLRLRQVSVTEVELRGFIRKEIGDGKRAETSLNQRPRLDRRERRGGTGVSLNESAFIQTRALLLGWSTAFTVSLVRLAPLAGKRFAKDLNALYYARAVESPGHAFSLHRHFRFTAAGWEGTKRSRAAEQGQLFK